MRSYGMVFFTVAMHLVFFAFGVSIGRSQGDCKHVKEEVNVLIPERVVGTVRSAEMTLGGKVYTVKLDQSSYCDYIRVEKGLFANTEHAKGCPNPRHIKNKK